MPPRAPKAPPTVRARVMRTLLIAAIGAFLGLQYAKRTLDPGFFDGSSVPGLYASAGAALAILAVRIFGLARLVLRDVLTERKMPPDLDDSSDQKDTTRGDDDDVR